ncbi:E3 SUMO-protein ligase PIAS2 [Garra rufa]|uniref:E3 SUMO-protein ligase PIAS2 n=1 Tax=Garra rufa TaxID=137080 RepID=UPI003CCECC87
MADIEELRNMVSSFRVSELQVLLGFAGRNKSGRKHELLLRALHLLRSGCSPAVQIKIKELYRRRYPRTFDGLQDLAALKSSIKSYFQIDSGATVVSSDLPLQTGHSDLLQQHLVSCESPVFNESKSMMNMQQSAQLMAPVHPDVQMKSLPFYDVLDVLIKPSSLGTHAGQRYHHEKYFIFALTPQQVREVCISRDFLPGGRRDYMVQIQLRFCLAETSCPQEDNYPNSLCIKVNGKLFPLPGYAPPPKNGVEQKRPGRPLNITSLVRLSSAVPNQIVVTWAPEIGKVCTVRQSAVVPPLEPSSTKKGDVIDLTLESSSDDEEDSDPPLKKRCLYMSKAEEMHNKGVLTYQPSTVRVPNVQALDTSYLTSSIPDYSIPFHHSTLSTIPTDMQSLDLFSLIQGDPQQHYRGPIFLDSLSSSLQSATTSTSLVSSSASYETATHSSSSSHETGVITGGSSGLSDIISLD